VIVDSSALVALVRGEPGSDALARAIGTAGGGLVPAPCFLETCMVLSGQKGTDSRPLLEDILAILRLVVLPFTEAHARAACDAFLRYGKGRHPAGLNFGDCMAYAAAQVEARPLLFIGDDFTRTDVPPRDG
jgi:ribonuclease VapC